MPVVPECPPQSLPEAIHLVLSSYIIHTDFSIFFVYISVNQRVCLVSKGATIAKLGGLYCMKNAEITEQ